MLYGVLSAGSKAVNDLQSKFIPAAMLLQMLVLPVLLLCCVKE